MNFHDIDISDKGWIDSLLHLSDFRGAEYCFTNLFVWKHVFQTRVARYQDFLLIRSAHGDCTVDIYPAGQGDVKSLIVSFMQQAVAEKRDFCMAGVPAAAMIRLQELFPGQFAPTLSRNSCDYIYNKVDLRDLQGKKYQPKRNHIARFVELPLWGYERIHPGNIEDCIEMNRQWCQQADCRENPSLRAEMQAATTGLRHFEALGLEGGMLRVDGRVVAYTVGEPLNNDCYIVHTEKAFSDIRGANPCINREFVRDRMERFQYINREDDAGDEGLRKAKNSYHPAFMQEKYFFAVPYNSISLSH